MNNREISNFLSSTALNATFIQKLKIKYRPYICPFNKLLKYTHNRTSAYDIGCGSGQFCALVAKYSEITKIKGIEIDEHLVSNANSLSKSLKQNKTISFVVFDGIHIPKDIGKYELVYMIDVYHHIPLNIRDAFMKSVYMQMKNGAILVFKDIDASSKLIFVNKIHDYIFSKEFGNEISYTESERRLTKLGFKTREKWRKNQLLYPHFCLVLEK